MKNVELILNIKQIDDIEDALVQFIDYLKTGDDEGVEKAKHVEKTYDEIYKQVKWYSR